MINPDVPQCILSILALLLCGVEWYHAREEGKSAFTNNPERKFSGFDLSEQAESYKSKTQVAFVTHKLMMVVLFPVIAFIGSPWPITKLIGYGLVGLYLLYQWHHLVEWHIYKKDNHGRRTAWLYVPFAIVWWWMIVMLLLSIL